MVTNKEIMTWVIEYNIYKYYRGIIEHIINTNHGAFTDVDCDNIKDAMRIADDIFKNITGTNIYEAIGLAYDYAPSTIRKKIEKQQRRIDVWNKWSKKLTQYTEVFGKKVNRVHIDKKEKPIVQQEYCILSFLKKIPLDLDIVDLNISPLSEEKILEITKLLTERVNSIYGDGTVGDISPALVVWDQYVIDSKIKKDIQTEKEKSKKSYDHFEFDIIENLVEIQHRNHCTNAIYHLDYKGWLYEVSITAVPYSK